MTLLCSSNGDHFSVKIKVTNQTEGGQLLTSQCFVAELAHGPVTPSLNVSPSKAIKYTYFCHLFKSPFLT